MEGKKPILKSPTLEPLPEESVTNYLARAKAEQNKPKVAPVTAPKVQVIKAEDIPFVELITEDVIKEREKIEKEILIYLSEDKSTEEIAKLLNIRPKEVRRITRELAKKLSAPKNKTDLLLRAREYGILK